MAKGRRTFIIGEAGVNHGGYLSKAKEMVNVAKDAQVDAIKFQTHFGWPGQEQYEFTKDQWRELFDYCEWRGIKWLSTPFDFKSIDFLKSLQMDIWKIPSGMVTNLNYIQKICETVKSISSENPPNSLKILLSTGMATEREIRTALYLINEYLLEFDWYNRNLTVMQCVTSYPALPEEMNLTWMKNLRTIRKLKDHKGNYFFDPFGLSDHTLGIEIPIAAVAMGASVIEKHFTLDRNMEGPDHKASLEPDELKKMVRCIRNVELAMGDGIKRPTPSEMKVRDEIRKEMVANA